MQIGTSYYISPEVMNGENYNETCDVFSFSMLMHEVLHNKVKPFGDNAMYIEVRIARDANFRPEITAACAQWAKDLIRACWSHQPSNRPSFASMAQLFKEHKSVM